MQHTHFRNTAYRYEKLCLCATKCGPQAHAHHFLWSTPDPLAWWHTSFVSRLHLLPRTAGPRQAVRLSLGSLRGQSSRLVSPLPGAPCSACRICSSMPATTAQISPTRQLCVPWRLCPPYQCPPIRAPTCCCSAHARSQGEREAHFTGCTRGGPPPPPPKLIEKCGRLRAGVGFPSHSGCASSGPFRAPLLLQPLEVTCWSCANRTHWTSAACRCRI